MALTKIHLYNFLVFSDIYVSPSKGINVIIGQNGMGKTQMLKAIYSDIRVSSDTSLKLIDYFKRGASLSLLLAEKNHEAKIEISTRADGDLSNLQMHHHCEEEVPFMLFEGMKAKEYVVSTTKLSEAVNAVYIPMREMLTHSKGILAMSQKYRDFPFDQTMLDILFKANQWVLKEPPAIAKAILPQLEKFMDGTIVIENEEFFIQKKDGRRINFAVEAEGLKKLGLLWQLLMNESITENSILLWDEPEANLNPEFLPAVVECLLELSRHGVQIFVSTHNYLFAKYFDVRRKDTDHVAYHSLYHKDSEGVQCETAECFNELRHNAIMDSYNKLLDEVYDLQVGE